MNNDKINQGNIPVPKIDDWTKKGFDSTLSRITQGQQPALDVRRPGYIAGITFDALLDEMLFNRMMRLKNLTSKPQGNEPGKIYWDATNKKYKIWVDSTGGWADVVLTTTSISTSSTSSSSSSISTTSTSISTTSSSSSSTSTS
jgi:hypothetical protein